MVNKRLTVQMSFRLTPELADRLERLAARLRRDPSALVRLMLEQAALEWERKPDPFEDREGGPS